MRELQAQGMKEKAAEVRMRAECAVPREVAVEAVACDGMAARSGLHADLMGAAGDQHDLEEAAMRGGQVFPDPVGKLRIGRAAPPDGGTDGAFFGPLDEPVLPSPLRRTRQVSNQRKIRLADAALFEKGAAGGGGFLPPNGEEHARGVLIEPVDEPDRAGGTVEAADGGIVAPLESACGARAAGVGMGKDAVGLGNGEEDAVIEQDGTTREERGGHGRE